MTSMLPHGFRRPRVWRVRSSVYESCYRHSDVTTWALNQLVSSNAAPGCAINAHYLLTFSCITQNEAFVGGGGARIGACVLSCDAIDDGMSLRRSRSPRFLYG